jgi:hypothetical protein
MSGIWMLGTPGHPVPGGIALCSAVERQPGYGRATVKPRSLRGFTPMMLDLCRSVRERSP